MLNCNVEKKILANEFDLVVGYETRMYNVRNILWKN